MPGVRSLNSPNEADAPAFGVTSAAMPLADVLQQEATRHPDKVALITPDRSWTFGEIDAAVTRLARALVQSGFAPGERIALHFTNGYELPVCLYACFRAGLAAVPLNTRMKGAELAYVLNHCGARIYLGQSNLYSEIHESRASIQLDGFFIVGDRTPFEDVADLGVLMDPPPWVEALGRAADTAEPRLPVVDEDAVAVIMYTSGTTARPKGVTHTHRTLGTMASYGSAIADARPGYITGIVLPACHIFGLSALVATWMDGNTVVMIPRFDSTLVLEQLAAHRVTTFAALPVMLNALVHHPNAASYDVSAMKVCIAGGDAVATELQRRFKETFGCDVTEACGMTEVQPYACNPLYGRGKVGSIGKAAPGATLRIVDPFGVDVPAGESGEVLVKSGAAMIGYWNDPENTAATIKNGWLCTGDLARVDEDGYYWFVGRKKEIIIRGGSNISPLEIEEALYQHPAVREVGVVGSPDAELGEIVVAYVAVKNGASASEAELQAFLGTRMAAYKVPAHITFIPELPKGLTGKVQRKALKELAARA